MKKYKLNYYLFILLIPASIIFSQNAILTGTVVDSSNGKPLVGANVFIVGTSLGSATTSKGAFNINNINTGSYKIKVSYIGYESKEIEIDLPEGKKYEQNFRNNGARIPVDGRSQRLSPVIAFRCQ